MKKTNIIQKKAILSWVQLHMANTMSPVAHGEYNDDIDYKLEKDGAAVNQVVECISRQQKVYFWPKKTIPTIIKW